MPTLPTDRYGLELSTSSPTAASAYSDAIDRNLSGGVGGEARLADAIAADEGFAIAHIALSRGRQFFGDFAGSAGSKKRALELAAGASRREQQHIAAMATAIDGDAPKALGMIKEHLAEFPRDAFLLTQANGPFGLIGFGGNICRHDEQFALLDSLKDAYGDDWFFLSAFSFAHNELGHFEVARRLAEKALGGNPGSGHSSHTMAHCFFETGDSAGGSAFLSGWLPGYDRQAILYSHLSWHEALFELQEGRPARVEELYASALKPGAVTGTPIIAIADAASLLWRQDLYGMERPAGSREELRQYAAASFPKPGIMFSDLHCALAYAAAGDRDALDRLVAALRERVAQGKVAGGEVVPLLAEAIAAFADGQYGRAADLIEPYQAEVVRVGGSNAQREVFEDTLLVAYLRSGRYEKARTLLEGRLARRPRLQDERWLAQAQAAAVAK